MNINDLQVFEVTDANGLKRKCKERALLRAVREIEEVVK